MAADKRTCPECGGSMGEGFIVDLSHGGQRMVPRWIGGHPERGGFGTGVKTKGRECYTVESYRCTKCGFLRSYAIEATDPPTFWRS